MDENFMRNAGIELSDQTTPPERVDEIKNIVDEIYQN
jgi:hypothetical protein